MLNPFSAWWPSETPKQHVTGFYKAMEPFHKSVTNQIYYNIAMMRGHQWAMYESGSDVLRVPAGPSWRIHAVENKILPLAIIQRGKLVPSNPTISCRPANMLSETDKDNSEMARMFLRAKWKDNDFQDELDEMALWMVPGTMGHLMTVWDGTAGTELRPASEGQPAVYTGDITQEAVSPFEIVPDYTVSRFKDMQRFIRVTLRTTEYVWQKYGVKVQPKAMNSTDIYQLKAMSLLTTWKKDIKQILDNHTLVMNMYELPSSKYPQGFHHICTEDADLMKQETLEPYYIPQPNGGRKYYLPLDSAQMIRIPGMLIGTNCVEQATSPQCIYNQGISVVMENSRRLGRTKVVAEEGTIAEGAMVEDPAEIVIEIPRGAQMPSFVKPPEMASYHLNFIAKQPLAVQDAFGIHDASQGVLPRRATSAKAINFLTEQDNERHNDPKDDIDKAVASSFRKMLNIASLMYTEGRIADLIGDDGKMIKKTITGEMFRAVDVTITRDIALPKEASARMDLAIEILDKKPSTEDLDIMFAIMQASDIEDLKSILQKSSQAEEIYVKMENFDLAKCIPRPVAPGEKHEIRIREHTKALRNPALTPPAREVFQRHIYDHQQQAGLEAQQIAQNAQAAQAGMPAPGPEATQAEGQAPAPQMQAPPPQA